MEPRVDFDDLLALAHVLKICPVDLMVPNEARDEPYPVTPRHEIPADPVRKWIRGENVLLEPALRPGEASADPTSLDVLNAIRWMPRDRGERVGRRFFTE